MTTKQLLTLVAVAATLTACQDPAAPVVADAGADATAVVSATSSVNTEETPSGAVIPGRYIVRISNEVAHPSAAIVAMVRSARGKLVGPLLGPAFNGFAVELSDEGLAALRENAEVTAIEPDRVLSGSGTQSAAPWGLDRADQRALPLNAAYGYDATASNVTVYILDSGINLSHAEFGGRAVKGIDYATPGGPATDCNGHGTHVAGIVGGATFGVAKGVKLVSVRVLDCASKGSLYSVINALNWVTNQKKASPTKPMVANLSLDAATGSIMLDQTVNSAINNGVTVVIAAGNTAADACLYSPGRVPNALTVAATDATDRFASYSNRGACVDLAAPGTSILSAWVGSTTARSTMSGTSMAAPHVAGAAALYLSTRPAAKPAEVATALTGNATTAAVLGTPAGTANRLLYTGFMRAGL